MARNVSNLAVPTHQGSISVVNKPDSYRRNQTGQTKTAHTGTHDTVAKLLSLLSKILIILRNEAPESSTLSISL